MRPVQRQDTGPSLIQQPSIAIREIKGRARIWSQQTRVAAVEPLVIAREPREAIAGECLPVGPEPLVGHELHRLVGSLRIVESRSGAELTQIGRGICE